MGNKFPAVTSKQVVKALKKIGFVFYRSGKGSHEFYVRELDRKMIMVSRHSGEIIRRKTLQNILDSAGLTLEKFKDLI